MAEHEYLSLPSGARVEREGVAAYWWSVGDSLSVYVTPDVGRSLWEAAEALREAREAVAALVAAVGEDSGTEAGLEAVARGRRFLVHLGGVS